MNSDGSNLHQLATNNTSEIYSLTWSPDGRMLLFSARDTNDLELYSLDIESGSVRQLTENNKDDSFASWSPDGSQIAFTSYYMSEIDLYVMNYDGSDNHQVASNISSYDARSAWRPHPQPLSTDR